MNGAAEGFTAFFTSVFPSAAGGLGHGAWETLSFWDGDAGGGLGAARFRIGIGFGFLETRPARKGIGFGLSTLGVEMTIGLATLALAKTLAGTTRVTLGLNPGLAGTTCGWIGEGILARGWIGGGGSGTQTGFRGGGGFTTQSGMPDCNQLGGGVEGGFG